MNIKNGNLNYDQSGRAYPDDHEMEENWDCIWENEGKYYKIEGYEWTEVSPYDEIVDEAYKNYMNNWPSKIPRIGPCSKEEFINRIKTDDEFSKTWGLKIEGRELTLEDGTPIKEINIYHQPNRRVEFIEHKITILSSQPKKLSFFEKLIGAFKNRKS